MRKVVGAFVMVLVLVGCATSGFTPVQDPTVRIESYGFSILPPQGSAWYRRPDIHLKNTDGIVIGKPGGSKTHTIGVMVVRHKDFNPAAVGFAEYATNPEVFAAYVKSSIQRMNPPGSRMRILELSAAPDMELGYCVRQYAKFEDLGSQFKPKVLIQEDWGYSCLHPNSSRVIIEMNFSERGLSGESDLSLATIREQFFRSLQFLPLR